jgi:glycerate-2-kinase
MASAFARRAPMSIITGMVTAPNGAAGAVPAGFEWYAGGHPDPNAASGVAGARALEMARLAGRDRALVLLLSGGASALLASPAAGLTLGQKTETARALMSAGVAIDGLNCVRKHLSAIKGGRLGAEAWRSLTLAISDVHGPVPDDPSVIGSGPTVADPTTFEEALAIARHANAQARPDLRVPPAVVRHLERGARGHFEETIKPGDDRLARAEFHVLGNRETALEGARRAAEGLGYSVAVLPAPTHGEAREAGGAFVSEAMRLAEGVPRPFCALAAGETTVRVTGGGRGGRNQEFALAVAPLVAQSERPVVVASAGTDGIDGPTDAAGALVDPGTVERALRAGRDWAASLADNDAYNFFAPLGDLIKWGATGTNVGDIHVFLRP